LDQGLNNRKQRVRIKGIFSDWVPVGRGIPVPQGSLLGPRPYTVYYLIINDLVEHVKKISFLRWPVSTTQSCFIFVFANFFLCFCEFLFCFCTFLFLFSFSFFSVSTKTKRKKHFGKTKIQMCKNKIKICRNKEKKIAKTKIKQLWVAPADKPFGAY